MSLQEPAPRLSHRPSAPDRRRAVRAGCGPAHRLGRAGSAGGVRLRHRHAAPAARRARRPGRVHGRGSGHPGADQRGAVRRGLQHREPDAAQLQQLLVRQRVGRPRDAAVVAHRGSSRRAAARLHAAGGAQGCRGARGRRLPGARALRRHRLRRSRGPRPRRALPARLQLGPAAHAERLQQLHAGVPDARPRRDSHRDGARGPHRPAGRARPSVAQRPAVARRRPGPLGRRHAGDRDENFRPDRGFSIGGRSPRTQRADAAHGAPDARRRGHAALRVHLRRRGGVRPHVLRVDSAAPHRQRGLRVRLPRRQLRPDEHPRGRARRGGRRGGRAAPH